MAGCIARTLLAIAASGVAACSPAGDRVRSAASTEAPPSAQTDEASSRSLTPEEGTAYALAGAKALIGSWRPLAFTGELQPYDPETDGGHGAFEKLLGEACRGNEIWQETRKFQNLMQVLPIAVETPEGPVLYTRAWEKGAGDERITYLGVRLRDRACASSDVQETAKSFVGNGDVLAVLIAAEAIRMVDYEADRRTLTAQVRFRAEDLAPSILAADYGSPTPASGPSQGAVAPPPPKDRRIAATETQFDLQCSGRDALISIPFEARYTVDLERGAWAMCGPEQCNDRQHILAADRRMLLLENADGFRTTYSRPDGVLHTMIDGPAGPTTLRRLRCTVVPFTTPS